VEVSQFLRPDGDQAQSGDWEAIPDDGVLWDKMDEAEANDADYAWHDAIDVGEYFEVSLSNPSSTPGSGTQTVRWRIKRIGGNKVPVMKCELRQGATVKASQTVEITDSWQALSFTTDAVTGWKSPGTCANVDRDGKEFWGTPDDAKTQDDATSGVLITSGGDYSDWLRCTNFGFTTADIPSGAIIVGIEVSIDKHADPVGKDIRDNAFYLRKSTGQVGDNKASATLWPTADTDTYITAGGSGDTWNAGMADSDIRDSGFGIDLSVENVNGGAALAEVDHVRVRIHYRPEITDWTDLRLRFLMSGGAKGADPAISWAEFEVPDAAGAPEYKPQIMMII